MSFIESGRSTPGRAMVIRLAESLGIPLRERNVLLLAAGYAPAYPRTRWDDPAMAPVRTAVEQILRGHEPYPAIVVDRDGDLVAANGAFAVITEGVAADLLAPPVSVPRLFLHPRGIAPRIGNFADWGWHVLDALRAQTARTPNPRTDELIAELTAVVPDRPHPTSADHLGFAVPLKLRTERGELTLITTLTHFSTAVDVTVAELRLEAFLPSDPATAELLRNIP